VRTFIDFDEAPIFAIPRTDGTWCIGVLVEGPQGWGEFSPPTDAGLDLAARWLTAAVEPGTVGWPDPVRGRIPVAVSVPAVAPEAAHALVVASGCAAADVAVAADPESLAVDLARVEAVRAAVGSAGAVRCEVRGLGDPDVVTAAIKVLDRVAGGVEFVVLDAPVEEVARVRARVDVRIAVPVSEGSADLADAADVLVLATGPLGGVRRALRVAERQGIPAVVASAGETTIGLSSGLALAGVLPELPFACSLGAVSRLTDDIVPRSRSLIPVDGHLPVAPMPPAPDADLLRRFAVSDAATVRHWRDLVAAALSRL
jgi:O-succinylbenzoate synthase